MTQRVVCIVGPTASGKSALAEEVALLLGTTVVSVDAMQVYRGMDVGTAKTPVARRRVPLEMVDVADVTEDYSARRFQLEARACVDRALAEGRVPVLCGGTGLYLDAVVDELDFVAGVRGDARRRRYEGIAEREGARALWELLGRVDPESAALIHPHNVRRVVRALEMHDEGDSYARRDGGTRRHEPHYDAVLWGIRMPRERLYARIDERVGRMFADGLVEEVRSLAGRGLSRDSTAGQAIGYKEVLAALAGETTMDEARELVCRRTRRYAKRQLSWLRRDGRVRWVDEGEVASGRAAALVAASAAGEGEAWDASR